jgi:hypothetical protein
MSQPHLIEPPFSIDSNDELTEYIKHAICLDEPMTDIAIRSEASTEWYFAYVPIEFLTSFWEIDYMAKRNKFPMSDAIGGCEHPFPKDRIEAAKALIKDTMKVKPYISTSYLAEYPVGEGSIPNKLVVDGNPANLYAVRDLSYTHFPMILHKGITRDVRFLQFRFCKVKQGGKTDKLLDDENTRNF